MVNYFTDFFWILQKVTFYFWRYETQTVWLVPQNQCFSLFFPLFQVIDYPIIIEVEKYLFVFFCLKNILNSVPLYLYSIHTSVHNLSQNMCWISKRAKAIAYQQSILDEFVMVSSSSFTFTFTLVDLTTPFPPELVLLFKFIHQIKTNEFF